MKIFMELKGTKTEQNLLAAFACVSQTGNKYTVVRECSNRGYSFESESAIELCPVCKHPKAYFFMKAKNY